MASVTLQNVVGKFSPRMVRVYTRDPWDKAVIATFAMAAAYAATLWLQMRAFATDDPAPTDPVLVGVLLIALTGISMIWYTGALVRWFRVDRVLSLLSRFALSAARSDPRPAGAETVSLEDGDPMPTGHPQPLPAAEPGYLAAVDADGLLELAEKHDVAFDFESVHDVDISALDAMRDLLEELTEAGIDVSFARVRARVEELMRAGDVMERLGSDRFFLEVDDGVDAFLARRETGEQAQPSDPA
jgi:hypothetical protein